MSKPSSRRNFLRNLAGDAIRTAPRLVGGGTGLIREPGASDPAPQAEDAATEPAAMPGACASVDELLADARELGLNRVETALAAMATRSLRLVAADGAGTDGSFSGGRLALPGAVADRGGRDDDGVELIACVAIEPGTLWVLRTPEPDGPGAAAGSIEVAIDAEPPPPRPPEARALDLAPELTIPRPWSAQVAALELTEAEADAWTRLRTELAARQGVPLGDSVPPTQALHRVRGFPDERRGDMPLACELLARGFELGGEPAAAHPQAAALEADAGRWRLLLQLSRDDELGWRWGPGFERLYLWSEVDTLTAGSPLSVRALVQ